MKTGNLIFLFVLALLTASIGVAGAEPIANFSTNVTNGTSPLFVQFTDNSTNATAWNWDFGDNETSILQNPVHMYVNASVYTVTLNVSDGVNYNSSSCIIIVNQSNGSVALVANYTSNVTHGDVPLTVKFNDSSTGSPVSWLWNFQDGYGSEQQNVVHTFRNAGTYRVSLNVSNGSSYDVYSSNITVNSSNNPVANFTTNVTTGTAPLAVRFTDHSTNATGWNWNFADNNTSVEQNPLHIFYGAGEYSVSLNATNGSNYNEYSSIITVNNTGGNSNLVANYTTNVNNGTAPLTVIFNDTSTGSVISWLWTFQDGANSTEQNISHTFNNSGVYTVQLNVSDGTNYSIHSSVITVNSSIPIENPPIAIYNVLSVTAVQPGQLSHVSSTVTGLHLSNSTIIGSVGTSQGPLSGAISAVVNGVKGGYFFAVLGIGILGAVIVLRSLGYF